MTRENLISPLDSWRDTPAKRGILNFVDHVTKEGSSGYVAPEDRIAVFDNDGTLWCEKSLPIQTDFFMRKMGELAKQNPSLRDKQPWKAVVEKDNKWLSDVIAKHYQGDDSELKVMAVGLLSAFEGYTVEQFESASLEYLKTAQHPTLKRPYLACAYQPMIELLELLEDAGFTNYIASGGGRDFMRPITQGLYGVTMDRVIGSTVALKYRETAQFADIIHEPTLDIFDDGTEKPVRIWSRTGRRPIFAAGNSNGDIPMLRFCAYPSRPSMCVLIDHDDEAREFSYRAGAEESLKLASQFGWTVVSMKNDWSAVFSAAAPQLKAA